MSAAARNGGVFDDFNDADANGWDLSDGNWTITADGKLKNTGVDAGDHALLSNFSYANYGVRAQVKHLAGAANFGIKLGNILVQWIGKWELRDGGALVDDDTVTPLTEHWLLITSDKAVLFLADGKLIFKEIRPATISGQLKLYTGATGTQVTFDDILVFRDPQLGITYLDGAGKATQTLTLNGLKCQVSETVYDNLGRPAVQTKTAEFNSTLFGFRPGFVIGMNWTLGDMTGGVADYYSATGNGYSNDEGFPYTRELYEKSPLGRVIETGLPGLTFSVGRSHTTKASYGKNNHDNFYSTFPAGTFPFGQYFETINVSPDGVWTITWTDKAGNVIVANTGPNESGIKPTTSYQYDDFGNVVQINPPNYHNPPTGSVAGDWPIVMSYDFFGRLKQKTTPDAQATYFYIYDKAGRMRFMMDANGSAQNPDHVQYWKYDALGRAIECGYIVQNWNATTLQNYADTNPTWPSTPTTWRKKYTYDYNGTTPYLKGRLYKVETKLDKPVFCLYIQRASQQKLNHF